MCCLAKHVPKPGKASSGLKGQREKFQYNAMVQIINTLMACPSLKTDTADWVKEAYADKMREEKLGSALECTTVDAYDEEWKATYLSRRLDISMGVLGSARSKDTKFISHLFRAYLNVSGAMKVPPECANPRVMEKACDKRVAGIGDRKDMLTKPNPIVQPDGTIDWRAGVYSTRFNKTAVATHITHRPTGCTKEIDPEYGVKKGLWTLRNNFDDSGAQYFKTRKLTWPCTGFFEKGEGPFAHNTLRGESVEWARLVTEAAAEVARSDAGNFTAQQEEADAFYTPLKVARQQGTKRAREALKIRSEVADARRRVSLD